MIKPDRYQATISVNNQFMMQTSGNNKDKLLSTVTRLLKSDYKNATCMIKDLEMQTIVERIKSR